MTEPATDQQILKEHLVYGMDMLRETKHLLTMLYMPDGEHYPIIMANALIESFATHVRNLIEFFNNFVFQDTVRAEEFTIRGNYDPAFVKWDQVEDLRVRINKQIAHLTRSRGTNKVNSEDREQIVKLLLQEAEKFRAEVRPDLLQWLPKGPKSGSAGAALAELGLMWASYSLLERPH